MHCFRFNPATGFTLVEMMIVLAIVAILLGIGMPSFTDSMRDKRLSALTSEFISAIYVARNESLTRRKSITLEAAPAGWAAGWTINDGDTVLHRYANPNPDAVEEQQILIFNGADTAIAPELFTFSTKGQVSNSATNTIGNVSILICDDRDDERGRTLAVTAFGTVQNTAHQDSDICANGRPNP